MIWRGTRRPRRSKTQELADEEDLSQYGNRLRPIVPGQPFRCEPRSRDSDGISMIRTRVDIEHVHVFVTHVKRPGDGVRYVKVGTLRKAGFRVRHTPRPANPHHVSVDLAEGEWAEEHSERFAACFQEPPLWREETRA